MKKRNIAIIILFGFCLNFVLIGGVRRFFTESASFFSSFMRNPKKVGSIAPSSQFLARSITKYIRRENGPITILEVGAGTGVFTQEIVKKMGQDDLLDVMEIDSDLCEILKEKFKNYENVEIHCVSILDWSPDYSYDFIVSGLPFNAFDADFVASILDKYKILIKSGGILPYFGYYPCWPLKLL